MRITQATATRPTVVLYRGNTRGVLTTIKLPKTHTGERFDVEPLTQCPARRDILVIFNHNDKTSA